MLAEKMPADLAPRAHKAPPDVGDALHVATQWCITLVFFACLGAVAAAVLHGWVATAMFSCAFFLTWGAHRMVRHTKRLVGMDAAYRAHIPPRPSSAYPKADRKFR